MRQTDMSNLELDSVWWIFGMERGECSKQSRNNTIHKTSHKTRDKCERDEQTEEKCERDAKTGEKCEIYAQNRREMR